MLLFKIITAIIGNYEFAFSYVRAKFASRIKSLKQQIYQANRWRVQAAVSFGSRSFELAAIPERPISAWCQSWTESRWEHFKRLYPKLTEICRTFIRFADETPGRLCVRRTTPGNPLNNYPHSICNHATSRLVTPSWSLGPLQSPLEI